MTERDIIRRLQDSPVPPPPEDLAARIIRHPERNRDSPGPRARGTRQTLHPSSPRLAGNGCSCRRCPDRRRDLGTAQRASDRCDALAAAGDRGCSTRSKVSNSTGPRRKQRANGASEIRREVLGKVTHPSGLRPCSGLPRTEEDWQSVLSGDRQGRKAQPRQSPGQTRKFKERPTRLRC